MTVTNEKNKSEQSMVDAEQVKLEKLRASLAIGEQQAIKGDFVEFSLEQVIEDLDGGK